MHFFPRCRAELRLEPGAEGEVGKAECRAGQFRRRAQRLHARPGRPRALEARGRAVEHPAGRGSRGTSARTPPTAPTCRRRPPRHRAPGPYSGCVRGSSQSFGGRQHQQIEVARKARLELGKRGGARDQGSCVMRPVRRDKRRECADRAADRAPGRTARCGRSAAHSRNGRSAGRGCAFCSTMKTVTPCLLTVCDQLQHVIDEQRREAHGRLVHADHARAAHQRARHGDHLLLAARQRAGALVGALGEAREQRPSCARSPARSPACRCA